MNKPAQSEWRWIPGFEREYEINAQGDVRSWKTWARSKAPPPRMMKVQVRTRPEYSRVIQLGLHGGIHDVDKLVARVFGADTEKESKEQ